jgi:phosphate starvation-inducible PhoH-like protein
MSRQKRNTRAKIKEETRSRIHEELSGDHDITEFMQKQAYKGALSVKDLNWTERQQEFIRLGLDDDTRIVFCHGPAGTAKTLLAVYCALRLMSKKEISDIYYIRSAVESSDAKLGYLPGSAEEKLQFYNLPFLEKLDELLTPTQVKKLEKEERLSMFPVNFTRGMSWNHRCIIFDEAQNSSIKEIITVLTRLGKGTRCFVLADPAQTDLHKGKGGFEKLTNIFGDEESMENGIHSFKFTSVDIMRSKLCKFLVSKIEKAKV